MAAQSGGRLDTVMQEERLFPPPASSPPRPGSVRWPLTKNCGTRPPPTSRPFGASWPASCIGSSRIKKVLEWNEPFAKWFVGGQTNASYNCLDAHLGTPRQNKAAIIWEGEPGDKRTLTYQQLHREVCKFANVLQEAGHRSKATWCRSTCRWCPSWRSPCWPARGSARFTR